MKKDFYVENAVVVLNDSDTYSGIKGASVMLFNTPNDKLLIQFNGIKDFLSHDEEIFKGKSSKDVVYGHIDIDFLLNFYLQHRDQHGDEL